MDTPLGLKLNRCIECGRLFYHCQKRDICVPCEDKINHEIYRSIDEREEDEKI